MALQEKPSEIFYLHHLSTKDEYQYQHALAVGFIMWFIAKELNYSQGNIVQVALAGFLADCGMAKVSPGLLQKKAALTANEFNEIRNHTKYSYLLVQNIPSLKEGTKVAIFQHHERLRWKWLSNGINESKNS